MQSECYRQDSSSHETLDLVGQIGKSSSQKKKKTVLFQPLIYAMEKNAIG